MNASLIKNFIDVQIQILESVFPRQGFGLPLFIGETGALETAITGGTYSQTTTTVTVTKTAHGLSVGQLIEVDALTGTAVDGRYTVATVTNANTFTYTAGTSLTTTGNITFAVVKRVALYENIAQVEADFVNTTPEYKAGQAFFAQGGNAKKLLIGFKTSTETYSQALTAIQAVRDDFYAVAIKDTTKAVQLALASTIKALAGEKIVFFRTDDANTLLAGNSTDLGSELKLLDNDYAHVTFHYNASNKYPEMAIMGRVLPIEETAKQAAGSTAWHHQAVLDELGEPFEASFNPAGGKFAFTQVERDTLDAKNVEALENDGLNTRTLGGKMAGGEWGDVIHGVAWLKARIAEDQYLLQTQKADNLSKVTYDPIGFNEVEGVLANRLGMAVKTNFIAENFTITMPKLENTNATDRQNRLLKDINFTARLTGAIKFMEIRGVVTI